MRSNTFLFLFIGLFFIPSIGFSQKQDYHWISGISNHPEVPRVVFGNMMSFFDDSIYVNKVALPIYMRRTPITISDENGDLLFYTNGNVVVNKYHEIMENGKGFNEGSDWSDFSTNLTWNSPYFNYCYMVYPDRDTIGIYYMIHTLKNYNEIYLSQSDYLQISKIDALANEGRGKVIYKNRVLLDQVGSQLFTLIQHANGKDWWVIFKNLELSEYTLLLMYNDNIIEELHTSVDTFDTFSFVREDFQSPHVIPYTVSHDGSIIQDLYGEQIVRLFNFDRCSGNLSLRDTFHTTRDTFFQDGRPSTWGGGVGTACFSPNGRYLYAWSLNGTYCYDLSSSSISESKKQISGLPFVLTEDFSLGNGTTILPPSTLGPDGKIYILQQYTHRVIENPDDPNDSGYCEAPCIDFSHLDNTNSNTELYSNNYPNYRLGPLENSSCDTIVSSVEEKGIQQHLKIYPNPASNQLRIEIDLADWQNKDVQLYIYDILGREIYHHQMTPFSYLHDIDVSSWPMGIYHTHLIKDQITLQVQKIVVQK